MRIPCCILLAASGLLVASNASLSAQTQPAKGDAQSDLSAKVQLIERRIEGLETRQLETSNLLKTLVKKLERPERYPDDRTSPKSEGIRLMGVGMPPTPGPDERWRYKFHQGRWWYLRPNDEWLYWFEDHWVPHRPPPPAASKVLEGSQNVEAAESTSGSAMSAQVGGSPPSTNNVQEGLRQVTEAVARLERQVQRQAAAQALLIRGQSALIDRYQKQADESARTAEALERKREQNQRDLVGVE